MAISANSKILASDITTMTGASSSAKGKAGFVPAPAAGKQTSFLRGDGTWVVPTNTTYSAGTGLSLSSNKFSLATVVTAGTIGGNSNATLNFSSTFTTPYVTYDAYGRITGGGTRTLTMPAAPSGGTATAVSNVQKPVFSSKNVYLPSGGTWYYWVVYHDGNGDSGEACGSAAGGTVVGTTSKTISGTGICVKTS